MPTSPPLIVENPYTVVIDNYEKKYRTGYGLQYPDGHVIRFHKKILQFELGMKGGRILDYGCGSGVHLQYFQENGFEPYGCDISKTAIDQCKKRLPAFAENFHATGSVPRLAEYFTGPFDLIFSNQVLYYLTDADILDLLGQFRSLMRPGAVFFATMMPPTNYYHDLVTEKRGEMSKIVLDGRLNEEAYINFKTKEETVKLFENAGFRKLHLGFYNQMLREDEGPTDHDIFVGTL